MKNVLVVYKGGGYDGCIFEWNYCYFDKNGQFHNIFSSGSMGCPTLEDFLQGKKQTPQDFEYYNLDDEADRKKLAKQEPISNLICIAKFFILSIDFSGLDKIDFPVVCDECGETFSLIEAVRDGIDIGQNPKGIGGIMSEYQKILCPECVSLGTCAYCGEYVGKEYIIEESGYCKWCHEEQIIEKE
jgi:hypothetical protein